MSRPLEYRVARLSRVDVPRVVDVLADAFFEYPVMRYVLADAGAEYDQRLRRLVDFFVLARVLRDEPLAGVEVGGKLVAAATMSFPARTHRPPELVALRDELWRDVGHDARVRYDRLGAAWRPLSVSVPHIHLNMIGVRRSFQGKGLARVLLDYVHQLAESLPDSQGVTLTTENPANLPLYEHMGYEVRGHAVVESGPETRGMFRKTRPDVP